MMGTIILTSAGFRTPKLREGLLRVLPKDPAELNLAFVTTASKVEENRDFVERDRKVLTELGFRITEIDVAGKTRSNLTKFFSDQDVVFVEGGNAFYLLKAVRESGFDTLVKNLIDHGVIYIGVSAGSYIACPTIEMATWKDPGRERFGLSDLSGLSLVPFLLSVHYNREKYREGLEEGIAKAKYPVRILTDDQALLVRDGEVKLIGTGPEINPESI